MTGDWIGSMARCLTRPARYERIVAPALADLQYEHHAATPWTRCRNYAAVWPALVWAIAADLCDDLRIVLGRDAQTSAWGFGAAMFAVMFARSAWLARPSGFDLQMLGIDGYAAWCAARLPILALGCLPGTLIPVGFIVSCRHADGARAVITTAAAMAVALVVATASLVRPATDVAERYFEAAIWRARVDPAPVTAPGVPVRVVGRTLAAVLAEIDARLDRLQQMPDRAHDTAQRARGDALRSTIDPFLFGLSGLWIARIGKRRMAS